MLLVMGWFYSTTGKIWGIHGFRYYVTFSKLFLDSFYDFHRDMMIQNIDNPERYHINKTLIRACLHSTYYEGST